MEGEERDVNEKMPRNVQKFIQYNDVNIFVYSKPFRKSKDKKDNEFEVQAPTDNKNINVINTNITTIAFRNCGFETLITKLRMCFHQLKREA